LTELTFELIIEFGIEILFGYFTCTCLLLISFFKIISIYNIYTLKDNHGKLAEKNFYCINDWQNKKNFCFKDEKQFLEIKAWIDRLSELRMVQEREKQEKVSIEMRNDIYKKYLYPRMKGSVLSDFYSRRY